MKPQAGTFTYRSPGVQKLGGRYHEVMLVGLAFLSTTLAGSFINWLVQTSIAHREIVAHRQEADFRKTSQLYDETSRAAWKYLVAVSVMTDDARRVLKGAVHQLDDAEGLKLVEASLLQVTQAHFEWEELRNREMPLIAIYFTKGEASDLDAVEGQFDKLVSFAWGYSAWAHVKEFPLSPMGKKAAAMGRRWALSHGVRRSALDHFEREQKESTNPEIRQLEEGQDQLDEGLKTHDEAKKNLQKFLLDVSAQLRNYTAKGVPD